MSKADREAFIEWLAFWTSFPKSYWKKQTDNFIELNYKKMLEETI